MRARDEEAAALHMTVDILKARLDEAKEWKANEAGTALLHKAVNQSLRIYMRQVWQSQQDVEMIEDLKTQEGVDRLIRSAYYKFDSLTDWQISEMYKVQMEEANVTIHELRGKLKDVLLHDARVAHVKSMQDQETHAELKSARKQIREFDKIKSKLEHDLEMAQKAVAETTAKLETTRGDLISLEKVRADAIEEPHCKVADIYDGGSTVSWAVAEQKLKAIAKEYTLLDREYMDLESKYKAKCADYEAKCHELEIEQDNHHDDVEHLKCELEDAKEEAAEELKETKQEDAAKMKLFEEEAASKVTDMTIKHKEEIAKLKEEHQEAMSKQAAQLKQDMEKAVAAVLDGAQKGTPAADATAKKAENAAAGK